MATPDSVELAAEVVAAFISNNPLPRGELPALNGAQGFEDRTNAKANPIGALEQVQHPGAPGDLALRQFDLELVGPGDDRPEQQLIVEQNDDRHRQNRRADRRPVARVVRLGDVRGFAQARTSSIPARTGACKRKANGIFLALSERTEIAGVCSLRGGQAPGREGQSRRRDEGGAVGLRLGEPRREKRAFGLD